MAEIHNILDGIAISTPAADIDPATITEFRDLHLRGQSQTLNPQIERAISTAICQVEHIADVVLLGRTYSQFTNTFPPAQFPLILRRWPVTEVISISYVDSDGMNQTMILDDVLVDLSTDPHLIHPSSPWPRLERAPKNVTVEFTAGYGTSESLPPIVKAAVFEIAATHFAHGLSGSKDDLRPIPHHLNAAIQTIRGRRI